MRSCFRLSVIALFVSSVACGGSGAAGDDPAASEGALENNAEASDANVVEIDETFDGKDVHVKKGGSVELGLKAKAAAGFRWYVKSTDRTLGPPSPAEGTMVADPEAGMRAGGSSYQIFAWSTKNPLIQEGGKHKVELEYRQGKNGQPAKSFSFTIVID